ncbi:amidophosphoribosyltransferase, partial [Coemansia sp. RSA 2049]
DIADLVDSCRRFNPAIKEFDTSVFDGRYVTGDVSAEYLQKLEDRRSDAAMQKKTLPTPEAIGLHNYK